ncbi:hypothetical protein HK099_006277 [Clydaea vesicula]|uniref:Pre-mRNA-splicing factor CWC24 n=1 Tax=Clydaea vesicula TaxID=447962 RepID=A0AAD5XY79_9FUNG|nr:hypothetical protein HK099_006277 [Clydaea vesicula]
MFKKKTVKKNIRKREKSSSGDDVETKIQKVSIPIQKGLLSTANKIQLKEQVIFKASGSAASLVKNEATRTIDVDGGEELNSNQTIVEAEDGVYLGSKNYRELVNKKVEKTTQSNASKIRAGPLYAPTNVRLTTRFDFAPDVCKDYKETGFCGFGDSCKFMHDRGDYKSGWEIDLEWDREQRKLAKELEEKKFLEETEGKEFEEEIEEDGIPLDCPICNREFKDPVTTKCGHNFCESCALKHNQKNKNCFLCNEPTKGIFQINQDLLKSIKEKKLKLNEREKEINLKNKDNEFKDEEEDDEENNFSDQEAALKELNEQKE